VNISQENLTGLLVKPAVALKQIQEEQATRPDGTATAMTGSGGEPGSLPLSSAGPQEVATPKEAPKPRRFHGSVDLDPTRVGRDASRIAEEVIAHLSALVGATVKVTLEIEADIPPGTPDNVVRTVTENSRTLKFNSQGFESE
jgi:hypothetical protein